MSDNEPQPMLRVVPPSHRRSEKPDPCRGDLDREENRALAALRPPRRGEDSRSPPQRLQFQARQHLRFRALGVERLRHRDFA